MKKVMLATAIILPLLFTTAFSKTKTVELKFGHYSVESHPAHLAAVMFANAVEKRTNGEVKITIFPNSKLGNSQEILEQVKIGAVDFAIPTEPAMAKYVQKFNLIGAPFAFKDYAQTDKFFNSAFEKWVSSDLSKKGFTYIARWEWGFRNYTNSKKPILTPEDFKGLKIRTPPDFVNSATVKALGGIAQTINFAELPMALKQGVVDGQENPIGVIHSFKMYETQKYLSVLNYTYNGTHLLVGKKVFGKLTSAQQKIIIEEGRNAGIYMMKAVRDQEAKQIDDLKKFGMRVDFPDTAPFKTAASSVWDELKKKVTSSEYKEFLKLLDNAK
ncbi:MAG: TRAP transporter substrate-binding protein [Spirochaetes bacterium]|nr:TRAP transporter substrate-binding protein [Spirochaetota bacterium]